LQTVTSVCAKDTVDLGRVAEEHIVKGHLSPNDRRMWIVGKNYAPSVALKIYPDCRRYLVGAENHGETSN